ncbi:MAG: PIN domain-containing protein [Gemmatimonadota bacterium]|nr:PIN domain-containing protein [Gemmatimonadota bacterium]
MTRYVFDTNVLVSAILFQASRPGLAFDRALDCGTILTSAGCIGELNDVLSRAKFSRYVDPGQRAAFPL